MIGPYTLGVSCHGRSVQLQHRVELPAEYLGRRDLVRVAADRLQAAVGRVHQDVRRGHRRHADGQQAQDGAEREQPLDLGFQPSASARSPTHNPERAEDDRRPDHDRNEPLVGLDDTGRQIPGRQVGLPRTECQGDRRRAEEPSQQGQRGRTDDAEQRKPMAAMPDLRSVAGVAPPWPGFRSGASAWWPSWIHACLPRSRLNSPETPPESLRSLSPA